MISRLKMRFNIQFSLGLTEKPKTICADLVEIIYFYKLR
jgi:hypothetical protein